LTPSGDGLPSCRIVLWMIVVMIAGPMLAFVASPRRLLLPVVGGARRGAECLH
jgi:hypothetical protein